MRITKRYIQELIRETLINEVSDQIDFRTRRCGSGLNLQEASINRIIQHVNKANNGDSVAFLTVFRICKSTLEKNDILN